MKRVRQSTDYEAQRDRKLDGGVKRAMFVAQASDTSKQMDVAPAYQLTQEQAAKCLAPRQVWIPTKGSGKRHTTCNLEVGAVQSKGFGKTSLGKKARASKVSTPSS